MPMVYGSQIDRWQTPNPKILRRSILGNNNDNICIFIYFYREQQGGLVAM